MINCLIRLVTFPVVIALHILIWCGMYVLQCSQMLCRFIAGMIYVLVIVGFVTGLGNGAQLTKMLIVSFAIFLIPQFWGITVDVLIRISKGYQHLFQSKFHRERETYGNHQNTV